MPMHSGPRPSLLPQTQPSTGLVIPSDDATLSPFHFLYLKCSSEQIYVDDAIQNTLMTPPKIH